MDDLIRLHQEHMKAEGFSKRTVEDAGGALDRLDRALTLGIRKTTRAEMQAFLGNAKWSQNTRENYFGHAARFYEWATDPVVDLLDINPMEGMQRPAARRGQPRPLSDQQLATIFTKAVNPYRLCAVIAYETGLRCCEIAGLHKEDVGEEDVYVRKAKGGMSATVPGRPAWLLDEIRDLPDGLLVEAVGGVADARWISQRSAIYFSRTLHMPGVSLHRIRHSYARRLRKAGADPWVIKRQLRHASIATTQIYVGADEGECREAVRGLTPPTFLSPVAS